MAAGTAALGLALAVNLPAQAPKIPVPIVDAELGPCSADFIITDGKFQPLYNARIRVHFKYGLWGIHRMAVQVGTNAAGKARVEGLPARPRHPLDFVITDGKASAHWFWTGLDCDSHVRRALKVH